MNLKGRKGRSRASPTTYSFFLSLPRSGLEYFFDRLDEEVFEHIHLIEIRERFVLVLDSDMFYALRYLFEVLGDFFQLFRIVLFSFLRKRFDGVGDGVFLPKDILFEYCEHIVFQIIDVGVQLFLVCSKLLIKTHKPVSLAVFPFDQNLIFLDDLFEHLFDPLEFLDGAAYIF